MTLSRRNLFARLLTTSAAALLVGATTVSSVSAQPYCGKANRECLVFISDLTSPTMSYAQKKFYGFVGSGAKNLARATLSSKYNKVHIVEGAAAERAKLSSMLKMITSLPTVKAVDLIFVTHGLSGSVVFSNGSATMSQVRHDIKNAISYSLRKKLRMVFSTACYGSSHRYYWLNAGFETASGSRRIYADSALSYFPFLANWAAGNTFQASVNAANNADPGRIQDTTAKTLLLSWGYYKWWDVNSYRYTSGRTNLRIHHRPY